MIVNAVEGCTRRLGKSQGYLGLPVRDFQYGDGTPAMLSSWQPTPSEIARILSGAPIYLTVLGTAHPPVMMEVGEVPA